MATLRTALLTENGQRSAVYVIVADGRFFPFLFDTDTIEDMARNWSAVDSSVYESTPFESLEWTDAKTI